VDTQCCPKCGANNAASFRFCKRCGTSLTATLSATDLSEQPTPEDDAIGQLGEAGRTGFSIWEPFAGYGQRGRHVSWLLSNLGERAEALREAVTERFLQRQIPRAKVVSRMLSGRGVATERRPYYFIRRGPVSIGLYIARFGEDLYISQVTYAKGAISPLRLFVLSVMVLLQLGYVLLVAALIGYVLSAAAIVEFLDLLTALAILESLRVDDMQMLLSSLCCLGPLWILNSLLLCVAGAHMVYRFITERDPLALLRSPANEFQQDDIIALEKAVEETVRQSLDAIGIDVALMPPAPEYGFKRRIL